MAQILLAALTAIILAFIFHEIKHSIRVMKFHQMKAKRFNTFLDYYAIKFEEETQKYLRQLNYQADIDSKYNE